MRRGEPRCGSLSIRAALVCAPPHGVARVCAVQNAGWCLATPACTVCPPPPPRSHPFLHLPLPSSISLYRPAIAFDVIELRSGQLPPLELASYLPPMLTALQRRCWYGGHRFDFRCRRGWRLCHTCRRCPSANVRVPVWARRFRYAHAWTWRTGRAISRLGVVPCCLLVGQMRSVCPHAVQHHKLGGRVDSFDGNGA